MFIKQADALAASFAAAVSSAITHGASTDTAIALGSEVQSSLLALLAFAHIELECCPTQALPSDVPPVGTLSQIFSPHSLSSSHNMEAFPPPTFSEAGC